MALSVSTPELPPSWLLVSDRCRCMSPITCTASSLIDRTSHISAKTKRVSASTFCSISWT
eukprot:CAMPEP_0174944018 /NCGR_PEP_ID=MMETSP1355-20121228/78123_1 /TAXON_ID=464990 /ORGANISM="Hemiselmis tepida, Strain CCMP443" /LENGTH=59 /DNA_ID=CAMNT_0016191297 /DNA_START=61 /DNA_END=237 /DNA_ORIENTATION=-